MAKRRSALSGTKAKIIVATCAVVLVLLIIALIVNLVRLSAINSRRDALAAENAKLSRLIASSDSMIEYCNSTEFVEAYAREFLDMVYRGETIIEVK